MIQYVPAMNLSRLHPSPRILSPLPPFDPSDSDGNVYDVPPPGWVPPGSNRFTGDFNGLTLDMSKWPGLSIPMLIGANSTPINMLMSPMLILYPRAVQDAYLTETCWRNYKYVTIAPDGWNLTANGFNPTTSALIQFAQYIKSWGIKVCLWRSQPTLNDPFLVAMLNANCLDWYIIGEEINSKIAASDVDSYIQSALAINGHGGIPTGVHFTSNYPVGFPIDTYLTDWSSYDNYNVHLMWQADQNDSAGKQGAMQYYARMRVQLGWSGESTYTNPAPNCRVIPFEIMATAQLFGQCTEEYGCLRSLEMMYTTTNSPGIQNVNEFGNGSRYPDGSWIQ
jgi:hypothetical protein